MIMNRLFTLITCGSVLLICPPSKALEILSPTEDGIVIGDTVRIIIKCGGTPDIDGRIGSDMYDLTWTKEAYSNRWTSDLILSSKGPATLFLEGTCGHSSESGDVQFDNSISSTIEIADLVLARFFKLYKAKNQSWNWVPAIFLYPLLKIAPKSEYADEYIDYVKRYHQTHLDKGVPKILWADHCPSALSAFDLATKHGDDLAWSSVEKVIDWIRTTKRNTLGSIDHVGYNNIQSLVFPSSIWVDSMMMWVLMSVKYGVEMNDGDLLDFALKQPSIFAANLRDENTGLFYHAWNIEKDRPYPANNTFWLRGNGWVLVSIVEILTEIETTNPYYAELVAIFQDMAPRTLPWRQPSGYYDTVIADPGYAYEESSGSALMAYAYAKGARLGLLPKKYRCLARDTFQAITSRMVRRSPGFTMEEISKGTNPSSKPGYKIILKDRNLPYGVGAFLLLADELSTDSFEAESCLDDGADDPVDGGMDTDEEPSEDVDTDTANHPDIDTDSFRTDDTKEPESTDDPDPTSDGGQDGSHSDSCGCRTAGAPGMSLHALDVLFNRLF